ncbi:MAG: 1-acyl-sn-glycerol-3-phosphate acyltransferase [Clostridia bacterium]|nr:1-acyl-sn-glycerol-3-phosphate acyltransferase [Clostridia bacterium]
MSAFYRFARAVIYPFFIWLLPVKIIGKENIPKDSSYILCSNHTSMSDPFFKVAIFKNQIHFMAKAELFKIPVVKNVLSAAGVFPVDRGKGDMTAIHTAEKILREGKILGIYPEGTRYKTGAPRKAKSGVAYIAMNTKADILPVSVYRNGAFNIFKKTTIRIGSLIKYNELVDKELSERANMKNIVNRVTDEITKLWEMKH